MNRVCAVIVTYHPDHDKLSKLLDGISTQVERIEVVDNTLVNVGLATGFNKGIEAAVLGGFSHVILFDQDSAPAPDMVAKLLVDLQQATQAGKKIGAIGPALTDPRSGRPYPFVRVGFPHNTTIIASELVECDFVISSGCLIPIQAIKQVGLMDDRLFIDNVDLEWCFRAVSKGFCILGSSNAKMLHEIGDNLISLPFTRRRILVHGPIRLYYIMRNRILLYWMSHVPRIWVAQDIVRIPYKFAIFAVLVPGRMKNIRYMLRGMLDGVLRRVGAYDGAR